MKKSEAYMLGVAQTAYKKKFRRKQRNKKIFNVILWIVISITAIIAVLILGLNISIAHDDAMSPRIKAGQVVITDKLSYMFRTPERGEQVIFNFKDLDGSIYPISRRVIGLPGETITVKNGYVYVNGQECMEEYASGATQSDTTELVVPSNTYYVLSDNRENTLDSRVMEVRSDYLMGTPLISFDVSDNVKNNKLFEFITEVTKIVPAFPAM